MNRLVIIVFAGIFGVIFNTGCGENPSSQYQVYNNDSLNFFAVNDFFQSQIKNVQEIPYHIYKLTISKGKRDSVILSTDDFVKETAVFLQCDISDKSVKKYYREDRFYDQENDSQTISYSTENVDLPVQNMEILLNPETGQVVRIFINRYEKSGDSTVLLRLSWRAFHNCAITKILPDEKNSDPTQTMIVWNGS